MYTLYYSPGACSMTIHVALEMLGATFSLQKIDFSKGENKSEAFLKINPRGQVGALQTPEGAMSENAAMMIYLNDKHHGSLLGGEGFERAIAMQWLMFANSNLHGAYSKAMFVQRVNADASVIKAACDSIQAQWDEVERHLNSRAGTFMCGDSMTAGDIYIAVVANWSFIAHLPSFGTKTKALLAAVTAHPAYQKALQAEGVTYKALDEKVAA